MRISREIAESTPSFFRKCSQVHCEAKKPVDSVLHDRPHQNRPEYQDYVGQEVDGRCSDCNISASCVGRYSQIVIDCEGPVLDSIGLVTERELSFLKS